MRAAAKARVCLAAILVAAIGAHPAHAASAIGTPDNDGRTVTLITGDRLRVSPDGRAASRVPTPGRDAVPLLSEFVGGHLEVVPADAVALLGDDRLDPRLFDVTGLLADGYRDAVPLIITYDQGDPASVVRTAAAGADVRDLDTINALSVRVAARTTASMWHSLTGGALSTAYQKVWLDGLARPSIDVSVPLVGAPAAWAAGYTGEGVPVGVLDTGIDATHPDLAQAVAQSADFTDGGDGVDRAGHGTHVASIIAGSGAASAGRFRGMAPDAQLYTAKVCGGAGCPESAILAGMQWAARDQGLKVVNLSLGEPDRPGTDLLEQAVDTLSARYGTLFVVAAGNDGPVSSPASADAALAVGASTKDDTIAPFSSRGSGTALKPDLVAPGADIVAARSRASALPPTGPGGLYTRLSGTSLAAPHVAGAAALLAEQHPDWTAARLKAALMNAATALPGTGVDRAGAGRLDVARAVASPVLAEPASLSFGSVATTRTVTYRNSGGAPVTLTLAVAGSGAFSLDADRITVPARDAASVVVRAEPGPRRATGVLTATGGDVSIRTPIAVDGVPRTVRLTVRYTDREGAPALRTFGGVYPADGSGVTRLPNTGGAGTLDLAPGTYTLDAKLVGDGVTVLDQPRLVLNRDTTVDLDARLGRPVAVASPRAGAAQVYAHVGVTAGAATTNLQTATFDDIYTAQLGGAAGVPEFRTDVAGSWARPGANSPYLYSLAWSEPGRFVTGFARTVRPEDLATVHAEYGRDAATGTMTVPFGAGGWGYTSTFDLPFRRTEYVTAGTWGGQFGSAGEPPTVYSAGRNYDVTWNKPVFSPAFPPGYEASRTGNTVRVDPAWFSDGSGEHGDAAPGANHRVTVTRDGTTVGDTVPAAEGFFTVTDASTRTATYSTSVQTTWTFRSGKTARKTALPLSTIRFAPAGNVLAFVVAHQPGAAAGPTTGFAVQVSYDDGKTWRNALASRIGDRGIAILRAPASGGFISLKASATDAAGNRVDQTIIRAY